MKKRLFYCCLGILIIGFGSSICKAGQVGVDPCTAMNGGIALFVGSTLGITLMTCQIILFIFIFFLNRSYIGPGTFINGLLLGYIVDAITFLINRFFDVPLYQSLTFQIPCMIIGITFITLGVSLYFTGDLGLSPYDAIGRVLSERTSFTYPQCRIFTDVVCTFIALLFHVPIGFGTIIIAFFTGPLIQFWNKKVSKPLFNGSFFNQKRPFHNMNLDRKLM